ncbi:hypothetical protein RFI_22665 [Reticulomyxa filosa]|uniref:SET domain-containing protein n=1 Tax=Reticulomyxa filosa TaxID=46433 RepID=X6ML12_RETFI|nr:hypothetical protein RFI_22665 [Reticulomyxa filosa]|eukprot:ETO14703.1 hypothetical protein RFI_22665 [Reticulomyxa filosa]
MSSEAAAKINAKARRLLQLMKNPALKSVPTPSLQKFLQDQVDNIFVCLRNGIKDPPFCETKHERKREPIINESGAKGNHTKKIVSKMSRYFLHTLKKKSLLCLRSIDRGLFIKGGVAPAGRVVCFYPGQIWREEDIEPLLERARKGDEMANSQIEQSYLANHPPKGQVPNVISVDVPKQFTDAEKPYIPTWHENNNITDHLVTVFVATNDLCDGDEIFLDYELGDAADQGSLPEWYHYIPANAYTHGVVDSEKPNKN